MATLLLQLLATVVTGERITFREGFELAATQMFDQLQNGNNRKLGEAKERAVVSRSFGYWSAHRLLTRRSPPVNATKARTLE